MKEDFVDSDSEEYYYEDVVTGDLDDNDLHVSVAARLLKQQSVFFARGDEIDKLIAPTLESLCTHKRANNLSETSARLSRTMKSEQYKEDIQIEMAMYMPFYKISPGTYLIGTKQRQI